MGDFMRRFLLFISLFIVLVGCKKGDSDSGSEATATPEKSIFSKWTVDNGNYHDFTGGEFDVNRTVFVYLPITQIWIDALNGSGRDTTGLVAGTPYVCELTIYFLGDESSGNISTNHNDIDTPEHNACLEWDSNCVIGACNYPADHLYTKSNNTLVIDYFGTADSNTYGLDYLE